MPRFTLPPSDTSWLDRAQSRDGRFDPALGFVLLELDGEHYAISGRYCGIPDNDEAAQLAAALHVERGLVLDEEGNPCSDFEEGYPTWLPEQASILLRFRGSSRTRPAYTFLRW